MEEKNIVEILLINKADPSNIPTRRIYNSFERYIIRCKKT